jgi:tRNA-Thr(GGU) m(6)t(6)A37 methyltransferase TsaA
MTESKSQTSQPRPQSIVLHPIGHVERSEDDEGSSWEELRTRAARIVLDPALTDGLLGLEPGSDIVVLFCFHRSAGYDLQLHPRGDPSRPIRGVFATRSPRRPNPIAATVVRIERVDGNVLDVIGLDALDGSPVLDIKVHAEVFDTPYA